MHNQQFFHVGVWPFSCKILYLDKFFLLTATPISNPSEHFKHFRKADAFVFWKLELCGHCRLRTVTFQGHFEDFRPGFRFWYTCHVDHRGQFTLKQLRLSLLSEMHTNIYTGPRLSVSFKKNYWIYRL